MAHGKVLYTALMQSMILVDEMSAEFSLASRDRERDNIVYLNLVLKARRKRMPVTITLFNIDGGGQAVWNVHYLTKVQVLNF